MHFLRMPLLAELATRRPESKSGALKCLTKYVYAVNQDNALCILFHSVLQTQKYTRNIRKAIEKCQKKNSNVHPYNACRATFVVFVSSAARKFDLSRPSG
jgi:hypothetical protein